MYDQIPHDMTSDQSLWDAKSRKLVAHFQCFSMVSGSDRDNLASVVMTCLRPDIKPLQYLIPQDYCLLAAILLWTLFFSILADIISSPYRLISVYSENRCSDRVDTGELVYWTYDFTACLVASIRQIGERHRRNLFIKNYYHDDCRGCIF